MWSKYELCDDLRWPGLIREWDFPYHQEPSSYPHDDYFYKSSFWIEPSSRIQVKQPE